MKRIYMDYAATTPVDPEVVKKMLPYFSTKYGNASSIHSFGMEASEVVEKSREKVADIIHARKQEIIFTAGGSESDNMAIKGVAYLNKEKRHLKGPHIITSGIEHPAVLEPCRFLEQQGFKVKYLPVDKFGVVDLNALRSSITNDTFLVSVMFANNEIGTIQPVEEISRIAKEHGALFHTDAVQAVGKIPVDVKKHGIDLLSLSSHKLYGPKGVGGLYIREGVKIQPLIHGGGHERGLRSGTLNTPGIVGLAKACELAKTRLEKDSKYLTTLRDSLIKGVLRIEESYLNGHPTKRLPNNAHIRFTAVEGESLLLMLNDKGVAVATGSACSSKKLQGSHVLTAIGINPKEVHGSLRFTLGRNNTKEDVSYVVEILPEIVKHLRMMSPLWNR